MSLRSKYEKIFQLYQKMCFEKQQLTTQIEELNKQLQSTHECYKNAQNESKTLFYKLQIYEKEFKGLGFCHNIFNMIFEYALIQCFSLQIRDQISIFRDINDKYEIKQNGDDNYQVIILFNQIKPFREIGVAYRFGSLYTKN